MSSKGWLAIRNIKTLIILFGAVMLCSIWAGLYFKIQSERKLEIGNTINDTANYARLLEENTARTIKGLDQVLLFLKYRVEHESAFIDIPRFIREKMFEGQPYQHLVVINENGDLVSANFAPSVKTNLVNREHFQIHKAMDDGRLLISKSMQDQETGKWFIQLI